MQNIETGEVLISDDLHKDDYLSQTPAYRECSHCDGTGIGSQRCIQCWGRGYIKVIHRERKTSGRNMWYWDVSTVKEDCRDCKGAGKISGSCSWCNGLGYEL